MEVEKGVMMVVYQRLPGGIRFLVLERVKSWEGWELPKGNLEDGHRETVRTELEEEAGIGEEDIVDIEELGETVTWEYERDGEERKKQYEAFLVEVEEHTPVDVSGNPDGEHDRGFFLGYDDAKAVLTYDNSIKLLDRAKKAID